MTDPSFDYLQTIQKYNYYIKNGLMQNNDLSLIKLYVEIEKNDAFSDFEISNEEMTIYHNELFYMLSHCSRLSGTIVKNRVLMSAITDHCLPHTQNTSRSKNMHYCHNFLRNFWSSLVSDQNHGLQQLLDQQTIGFILYQHNYKLYTSMMSDKNKDHFHFIINPDFEKKNKQFIHNLLSYAPTLDNPIDQVITEILKDEMHVPLVGNKKSHFVEIKDMINQYQLKQGIKTDNNQNLKSDNELKNNTKKKIL